MSDTTPALDEAFERMAAASFELPNGFVNHGAMACEALAMLDCTDDIDSWARRFARAGGASAGPVVPAEFEWPQAPMAPDPALEAYLLEVTGQDAALRPGEQETSVRRVLSSGAGEFLVPLRMACEVGFLLRLELGALRFRSGPRRSPGCGHAEVPRRCDVFPSAVPGARLPGSSRST